MAPIFFGLARHAGAPSLAQQKPHKQDDHNRDCDAVDAIQRPQSSASRFAAGAPTQSVTRITDWSKASSFTGLNGTDGMTTE
jgi:hypothetical protein